MDNMESKDNMDNMKKKKISLKEIGLPKLIMIFIAGILIILLSFPGIFNSKYLKTEGTKSNKTVTVKKDTNTTSYDTNTYITEMENKLVGILKKVSGIGDVKVMITLKSSEKQIALKDTPSTQENLNEADGEGGNRTETNNKREESTVTVTDENGNSVPYIIQKIEPEVEGILVVAEGGDDVNVQLDIINAAEALFDVPANKVIVMDMDHGTN